MKGWWARAALAAVAAWVAVGAEPAEAKPLTLATGPELATYFPVGVALRMLLEQSPAASGAELTVLPTKGSVENLDGLRTGRFDLAIVQADLEVDAFRGTGVFAASGRFEGLRSVLSLHEEGLALVVRPDVKVKDLKGLKGRKVDLGAVGSGGRPIVERLTATLGVKPVELRSGESAAALCDRRIDAAFLFIGHPSPVLVDALSRCKGRLLPVVGPLADQLRRDVPEVTATSIPVDLYPTVRKPVPTIGVRAVLVARADTPDAALTAILATVQQNRELLRMMNPALSDLRDRSLKPEVGAVPLHPAAERFFEGAGKVN